MENFKVEIFDKERSGEKLLFDKVQSTELLLVVEKLEYLLSYKDFKDSISFFKWVDRKLDKAISGVDTDNLLHILDEIKLDISPGADCYLIWNFSNDIDRFDLNYLIRNWQYVWYSNSDDAVVLLIDSKILILITHYGIIKYFEA